MVAALLLSLIALPRPLRAADAPPPVSFVNDVAPILVERCQACHGPEKVKGKYRLDTFDRLQKPGSSDDPALTPGKPDASTLYGLLVTHEEDDRMPKKADPLPAGQIETIRRWIAEGGRFDGKDKTASLSSMAPSTKHPDPPEVYRLPVPITALAFSPDGKMLAASGYHEVTLWDAETGALRGRLKNLPQRTLGLAWSPDGKRLATAGGTPGAGGEVRLIDPAGEAEPRVLDRTSDLMLAVRFSPDGSSIGAGGADNTIRVYDGASGERKHLIEQHADWVTDVAFSPDGKRLASASRDKTCRVFDVATVAMESAYVEKHDEAVYAIVWNTDGKRVFSGGRDRKLHCWNPENGNSFFDEKKGEKRPVLPGDIQRLATAGENVLAAASDGVVRAYTQANTEPAGEYPKLDDWAHVVTVHEQSGRVAAGGHDGAVRVWERDGKKQVAAFVAVPGRADNAVPQ